LRVILEPGFVLHATPYREASMLVSFFTQHQGKISGVVKGARGLRPRYRGLVMPFSPLLISFSGKTDLMQITAIEPLAAAYILKGNNVFNGLYLNELLLKLLPKQDAYPLLFSHYQTALQQLQSEGCSPQIVLRTFEKNLLAELGYGLQLNQDAQGRLVSANQYYTYHLEKGLVSLDNIPVTTGTHFLGSHLLAIEQNQFSTQEILMTAKRLMRLALRNLLGDRQLTTRELFT